MKTRQAMYVQRNTGGEFTRPLLLWNSSKYYMFVCVRACVCGCGYKGTGASVCSHASSLTNPACNAPPYCHLRPLWLHHIFPYYLINGTTFGKKLLNIKCVF